MTYEMTAPPAELYCPTCELQFPVGELCPNDGTRLVRLGAPTDPFVGRELDGRYTILDKLGQGGMGAVYRARQHSMGREVAVKVVNQNVVGDAHSIKRFLREAKLVSRLAHPNIVAVLDFGQAPDGVFYLVMELVEGRTLHDALVNEDRIALPRMIRIAAQICDALEGAHRMPIVHRDLKPANIMLLAAGRDLVKVLDFGLAKSLSVDNTSVTMTSAGALLGTPTFMPPEVANGEPFIDGRADLYSLGCILFLMGSGRPPFVSDSIPEMIAMQGMTLAPAMKGVPAPIARVIDRLLLKDPARRYQTAAETREALETAFEETRSRGMYSDTVDEELVPVQIAAETIHSMPPERPSELRTTNVFASAIVRAPVLPLPPPPVTRDPPAAPAAAQTLITPRRRSPALAIGAAVAIVAVIAAIVVVASRGDDDARGVAPTPAPAEPASPAGASPPSPSLPSPPPSPSPSTPPPVPENGEKPKRPAITSPIKATPTRPDKPRARPTAPPDSGRGSASGSGSPSGSARDPRASPF